MLLGGARRTGGSGAVLGWLRMCLVIAIGVAGSGTCRTSAHAFPGSRSQAGKGADGAVMGTNV